MPARKGHKSLFVGENLDLEVGFAGLQARERDIDRAGDHLGHVAEFELLDDDLDVRAALRLCVEHGGQQPRASPCPASRRGAILGAAAASARSAC